MLTGRLQFTHTSPTIMINKIVIVIIKNKEKNQNSIMREEMIKSLGFLDGVIGAKDFKWIR
jgi:hypothetical protein